MSVIQDYPPNIEAIRKVFVLQKGTIFTYGNKIYNPDNVHLTEPLRMHEGTHMDQQRDYGVVAWWDRYLIDDEFRFEQELEAHRVEYKTFCKNVSNREQRNTFLNSIASRLSSPMYARMVGFTNAITLIKKR